MTGISRVAALSLGVCLFAVPAVAQAQSADLSTSSETTWRVRAALNVAALACRGSDDDLAGRYNAMLDTEQAPLADAAAGTERAFKARYAAHWQDAQDAAMTRAYNHFASPPAHAAFCAAARDVLTAATTVEPSDFAAFAAAALPGLEAPFGAPQPAADPVAHVDTTIVAAQDADAPGGPVPGPLAIAYAEPRR